MTKTEGKILPRRGAQYTGTPSSPPLTRGAASDSARDPAAVIAELMQKRVAPTRSREEQAFIDLQRGCHG